MAYKLWLDDQYDEPEMPWRHPPDGYVPARSTAEAIQIVQEKGLPFFISFDHDLGDDDKSTKFIDWMIDNYYEEQVPDYQIHSANPVGAPNIQSKMDSWKKSQAL